MDIANCEKVIRFRLDMTLYNKDNLIHDAHIDFPNQTNNVSCVYYVNETDGDTIIFNETNLKGNYTIKKRRYMKLDDMHSFLDPNSYASKISINFKQLGSCSICLQNIEKTDIGMLRSGHLFC